MLIHVLLALGRDSETTRLERLLQRRVTAAFEKRHLLDLLWSTGGKVGETAERARLNERSLYGLMRMHGLKKERFRQRRRDRQERGST